MELIWIKKTTSNEESKQIVECLEAGKELSGIMKLSVQRVKVAKMDQTDVVPDTSGDYVLLGLRDETDPKSKMQLPRR
jgi:hypothetical protein